MTKKSTSYPNIDLDKTGLRLKKLLTEAGYTVKAVQEYLHLSCPQPIYRWFQGRILPSVDHLYRLSRLLGVHMEELLVEEQAEIISAEWEMYDDKLAERAVVYWRKIYHIAA